MSIKYNYMIFFVFLFLSTANWALIGDFNQQYEIAHILLPYKDIEGSLELDAALPKYEYFSGIVDIFNQRLEKIDSGFILRPYDALSDKEEIILNQIKALNPFNRNLNLEYPFEDMENGRCLWCEESDCYFLYFLTPMKNPSVVGGALYLKMNLAKKTSKIEELGVMDDFQRRGLGSLLLQFSLATFFVHGIDNSKLVSTIEARNIYLSSGFYLRTQEKKLLAGQKELNTHIFKEKGKKFYINDPMITNQKRPEGKLKYEAENAILSFSIISYEIFFQKLADNFPNVHDFKESLLESFNEISRINDSLKEIGLIKAPFEFGKRLGRGEAWTSDLILEMAPAAKRKPSQVF